MRSYGLLAVQRETILLSDAGSSDQYVEDCKRDASKNVSGVGPAWVENL